MCEKMSVVTSGKPRQNNFFNVCSNCPNGCCRRVRPPLTQERKKVILSFLEANNIKMTDPFEEREYSYPKETAEGYCIFWNKTSRKCQVQPVKPETCVAGPVTFDINSRTGKIEWWLKKETVCPLAGALYKRREDLSYHMKSAKTEILRLVKGLSQEALHTIVTIQEPDTFKIDEDSLDHKSIVAPK